MREAWQRAHPNPEEAAAATPPPPVERVPLRQLWGRVRTLVTEQFRAGGTTIDTPPVGPGLSSPGAALAARTVIQPDGDLLCFVDEASWADVGVRASHQAQIAAWFASSRSTVTAAEKALRRTAAAVGATVALIAAVAAGAATNLLVTALVFVAGVPTARLGARAALGAALRRKVDRLVHH